MRFALALVWFLALATSAALAEQIEAHINLSDQRMTVSFDGEALHDWPVSTARQGKFTPVGLYTVQSMKPMHYSTLYNNAPMPWSIFFSGNFAIHGTDQVDRLGEPASAGCVRLHPEHAKILYDLVLEHGRENTLIVITR